jgi:hypothetical protein
VERNPDGIFLFINDEIMSAISYYGRRIKEIERIRLFKSVMRPKHLQILLRLEIKGFV